MIYIIIAAILLICSFVEVFCTKQERHFDISLLFGFIAIALVVIAGSRQCGYDYINYKTYFEILHSPFWKNQSEGLAVEGSFGWLCYILPSYDLLVFLFAALSLGLILYFVKFNSPYPIFSIFLLLGVCFYSTYMGQFRQGLAISILLMSFMAENKWIKLSLNLFACIFHVTAVLGLLQFIVPKTMMKGRFYLFSLLGALVVNLTCYEVLIKIMPHLPGFLAGKLSFYVATEKGVSLGLNMAMLLRLTFFGIFYKNRGLMISDKQYDSLLNLYFVSLLIYLGFGFLPQIAGRGGLYFNILEIVLAAKVLHALPNRNKEKYVIFAFFVAVSLYRQLSLFTSELGRELFLPYQSWLV